MTRSSLASFWCLCVIIIVTVCVASSSLSADLQVKQDPSTKKIEVFREGAAKPIVTQNARPDFRPYLHPIVAPDGKGELTQYSPGHHKHQTGLYWGFTRVNGRDYFHHPEGTYWKRIDAKVLTPEGHEVKWQTVYDLLAEDGSTVLTETQTWSLHVHGDEYELDLEWSGHAKTDVTVGKYNYGGLFLRMPWKRGMKAEVMNTARNRNLKAEGKRSPWLDLGMQVEGRDDLAHIAIFDHPKNKGFPLPWRVDGQFGVGPVRARSGDWHIKKGNMEVIRHRLLVYTGKLNDVALTNKWGSYSGQGGTWSLWKIAQQEGRRAEFLTPQKAVENMTIQDGFAANVYAAEPMMTQPMAFCWDDRGRMWIAENRDYESRGSGFANSGDSRIVILEDKDRDGVADSRKVFAEGIPFPSAIAVGMDGLWLGAPPNLLFVPDRNQDDVADMDDIEVRLTGWGIRDRHETLNSFHWGPDGWLYGCQGFATPSRVGKPAGKGKLYKHKDQFPTDIEFEGEPVDINGGVFRYHPTKDRFEVVAHGFSNPWGIDYDSKGQIFITACVIPHLWHVVPGGIYHRQGGRHYNPHVYSDIRTITDHRHRSAHGGARIYISDAFPKKYHDRIFMANIHEHAVLTDILEPKGSGFVGRHGDEFLLANNAQWIGFSMEIGPAGDVYVLDWHDADICGKEVLNKDTGRIFRLTSNNPNKSPWPVAKYGDRFADVSKLSDLQLVNLQESKSAWHARRARVVLQNRSVKGQLKPETRAALLEMLKSHKEPDYQLRALWALHVTGGVDESVLLGHLDHQDEHLRAWSIQLLCEDKNASTAAREKMVAMAKNDQSAVVRLYLAAALQRVDSGTAWQLAEHLVRHEADAADHNIPKMIWFGVESLVPENQIRAVQLASASKLPLVSNHIARRLADANLFESVVDAIGHEADDDVQRQLLLGLRAGLEGRSDVTAPSIWGDVMVKLEKKGGEFSRLGTQISQQFGDKFAAEKMLATVLNQSAKSAERQQAMRALAVRKAPELKPHLLRQLRSDALRREAIQAMAAYEDDSFSQALLKEYKSLSDSEKLDAVQTLASRSKSGRLLTGAIKDGSVPRRDIPAYVARQLQRVVGNGFLEVWGPIETLSSDQSAAMNKYRDLLTDDAISKANLSKGRKVFSRTCVQCHKLYGQGGNIGPDITGANRTNLDYLLSNILTPSAVIQDAYRATLIITDDGRVYSGIVAGENERQVHLRMVNQDKEVIIPKSQIEEREIAKVSMMPNGLLQTLKDQEAIDLIAYLKSLKQVPLP